MTIRICLLAAALVGLAPSPALAADLTPTQIRARLADASQAMREGRRDDALRALAPIGQPAEHAGSQDPETAQWAAKLQRLTAQLHAMPILAKARPTPSTSPTAAVLAVHNAQSVGARCTTAARVDESATAIELGGREAGQQAATWLHWTAPAKGTYALHALGDGTDPAISVYTGCEAEQPLSTNDDSIGLDAAVAVHAAHPGQRFWLRVSNNALPGRAIVKATEALLVSGRVTNEGGNPLYARVEAVSESGSYLDAAYTDPDGYYTLSLSAGTEGRYTLRTDSLVYKSDYLDEAWNDRPCPRGLWIDTCSGVQWLSRDAAEHPRQNIDFVLGYGATLTGRISDSRTGDAVAGATVYMRDAHDRTQQLRVDDLGRYRMRGLDTGAMVVWVTAASHRGQVHEGIPCADSGCSLSQATPVEVEIGSTTTIDLALQPRSYVEVDLSIDGVAVDGNAPLYGSVIAAYHSNGVLATNNVSRAGGSRYRIGPLAPGSYRIRVGHPDAYSAWYPGVDCATDCTAEMAQSSLVTIAAEGDVAQVAIDLRGLPALTGRVSGPTGEAPNDAYASLYRDSTYATYWTPIDADGRFEFDHVAPGEYLLHIRAHGYIDEAYPDIACESLSPTVACSDAPRIPFALGTSDRDVAIELEASPALRGQFRFRGQPITNPYYSSHSIKLMTLDLTHVGGTRFSVDAETATYTLTDIRPGSYIVVADVYDFFMQPAGGPPCVAFSLYDCSFDQAEPYVLGTQDASIDFDLALRNGRYVVVRDRANDAPLANVAIDVWLPDGRSVGNLLTGSDGGAILGDDGYPSVLLSTDNYLGYIDQVHDAIECRPGTSVFRGTCKLTGATPLSIQNTDPAAPDILFSLRTSATDVFFADGFE